MSELQYVKLDESEVATRLESLAGWTVENGLLTKTFSFPTYLAGVDFAANVGQNAEAMDHHPEILITWRKVRIAMNTHAVEGLSPYDFELARRVEQLAGA